MENEKLGMESAFPSEETVFISHDITGNKMFETYGSAGISKRFYAATKILQGFASDPNMSGNIKAIVENAYTWADELIRQEDL